MFVLQYTPYILPLLLSAAALLIPIFISWQYRHHTAGKAFFALIAALFLWSIGFALEIAAVNLDGKIFWANIQFLGIVNIPITWLIIVLDYTGRKKWLGRILQLLLIWALVSTLIIWTNPAQLFRQTPVIDTMAGPFPVLAHSYGLWFYLGHVSLSYLIYLVTYILLITTFVKSAAAYRRQIALLLIALTIPMLVDALYIIGLTPIPNFNFTPIVFSLIAVFLGWMLFRYRFLDLMPVARSALVSILDDAWIVLDHANRFVDLNPAAARLFEKPVDNLIGQSIALFMQSHPDLLARFRHNKKGLYEIKWKDQYYDLRLTPLTDKNGRLSGRLILLHNSTARKTAEAKLRQLSHVVEQTADAVFITDIDGIIEYANPAFTEQTGYPLAEAIGQTPRLLKSGEHAVDFYNDLWQKLLRGEPYKGVFHNKHKDGTLLFEEKTITPLTNPQGEIIYFVSTGRNITQRKQNEAALQAAMQRVEAAHDEIRLANQVLQSQNTELDAFAHTVAHDLKTPLAIISGYAEMLTDPRMTDKQRQQSSSAILKTSQKMAAIIDELLLLSSLRKEDVVPQPLDMQAIMHHALSRMDPLIQERNGRIETPEKWPMALGHSAWIEEVWCNYLSNGLKYGDDPPLLVCGAAQQEDHIRFWVRDNGPGILPELMDSLFTEFTRLDKARAQGNGLGLSIVHRIITKLDGEVGVTSPVDEGCTFYFTLPAG